MTTDEQVDGLDEEARSAVERMVAAVDGDWTTREATAIDDGGNETVAVTVETGDGVRECVLKATDEENGGGNLAAEAKLLRLLGAETAVPVPAVYGVVGDRADLPTPLFLMERVGGDPLPADASIPDDEMVAYARQVGRALGEVHDLDAFDGYGPVVDAERVDPSDAGGTRPLAREYGLALDDPRDSWEAQLAATAERMLDGLADGRFDDIVPDLRAAIDRRQRRLDLSGSPVLARIDHHPANMAVDRESRTVTGLLDWGLVRTAHPEYELVCAEHGFCGTDSLDSKRRERVRTALYEGYDGAAGLPSDGGFESRRRLHLLVFLAANMTWVSDWVTPETAEEVERDCREFVAELL
ncbi:phosphotransferase family protein [Halosimplex marinum]|uniref:phosphotransferase family protein n=1 Tax=Halosimplex marinum TaxID=3396620 RepID=UPI003F56E6D9